MIGETAVFCKMFDQSVLGIGFQDLVNSLIDDIPVIAFAVLADILLDTNGRYKEFVIGPACGGIAEEGEGRGVGARLIGGKIESGMCRWDKCSYGPTFFTKTHFAGEHVDSDASSAGQFVEGAAIRQFDPFFCWDGQGVPAATAGDIE
jgi:hypothetical protein